jgi:hypothetical protein
MATAQKRTFVNLFADDTEPRKTFGSLPGAALKASADAAGRRVRSLGRVARATCARSCSVARPAVAVQRQRGAPRQAADVLLEILRVLPDEARRPQAS